jgi:hypothetical protein
VSSNQANVKQRVKLSFCGLQPVFGKSSYFPLWNVVVAVDGLTANSTVSEGTLRKAGISAPNPTGFKPGDIFES